MKYRKYRLQSTLLRGGAILYLDKLKLRKLLKEKADGNYRQLARELDVDPAQLHRIINSESIAGPKFLGKLMVYCKNHNLDFNNYIFFE